MLPVHLMVAGGRGVVLLPAALCVFLDLTCHSTNFRMFFKFYLGARTFYRRGGGSRPLFDPLVFALVFIKEGKLVSLTNSYVGPRPRPLVWSFLAHIGREWRQPPLFALWLRRTIETCFPAARKKRFCEEPVIGALPWR